MPNRDVLSTDEEREPAKSGPRFRLYSEKTVAAALLLICAVLYYLTTFIDHVPDMLLQGMQAATYPQVVVVTLVLLVGFMLFETRGKPLETPERIPRLVYLTIVAMCVSSAICAWVDFFGGLILFIAVTVPMWGMRRPVVALGYGILFALAIHGLFALALGVRFPHGPLTDLLG